MRSFKKSSLPRALLPPVRSDSADDALAAPVASLVLVRGATIDVLSTDQIQSSARSGFGLSFFRLAAVRSPVDSSFVSISDLSKSDAAVSDSRHRHRRH